MIHHRWKNILVDNKKGGGGAEQSMQSDAWRRRQNQTSARKFGKNWFSGLRQVWGNRLNWLPRQIFRWYTCKHWIQFHPRTELHTRTELPYRTVWLGLNYRPCMVSCVSFPRKWKDDSWIKENAAKCTLAAVQTSCCIYCIVLHCDLSHKKPLALCNKWSWRVVQHCS